MSLMQYNELIAAASAAQSLAYSPYSGFEVGAGLITKAGKILAAIIDGKVQEFNLAELLPFPSEGILVGSRDV